MLVVDIWSVRCLLMMVVTFVVWELSRTGLLFRAKNADKDFACLPTYINSFTQSTMSAIYEATVSAPVNIAVVK